MRAENKETYIKTIIAGLETARQNGKLSLQQLTNVYAVLRYYQGDSEIENMTEDNAYTVVVDVLETGSKAGAFSFQSGAILFNTLVKLRDLLKGKGKETPTTSE